MTPELARLSRTVDAAALGGRIKGCRVAKGLTQQEAAEPMVSAAYISRIEAGNRRPDVRLLEHLAERLDTTVEALIVGVRGDDLVQAELELEYAELALRTGDADGALARVRSLQDGELLTHDDRLTLRARILQAQVLETLGRHDEAIGQLEKLVTTIPHDTTWLRILSALSRCYRETGELGRAVDVGQYAVAEIDDAELTGTDAAIQLAMTVAAASFERGDVHEGLRLVQEAMTRAEEASPAARATAYWNASLVQTRNGDAAAALPLARRAVELMEQADDARNLARLKGALASIQIRLDPPDLEGAQASAAGSLRDLERSGASELDQARVRLTTAKVHLLAGRLGDALTTATGCLETSADTPLLAAETELVLGRIHLAGGQPDAARESFQRAAQTLTAVGSDRRAGETWFELGTLLQQVDDESTALDAFRRAAASTGMQPAPGLAAPLQPARDR